MTTHEMRIWVVVITVLLLAVAFVAVMTYRLVRGFFRDTRDGLKLTRELSLQVKHGLTSSTSAAVQTQKAASEAKDAVVQAKDVVSQAVAAVVAAGAAPDSSLRLSPTRPPAGAAPDEKR